MIDSAEGGTCPSQVTLNTARLAILRWVADGFRSEGGRTGTSIGARGMHVTRGLGTVTFDE